MDSWENTRDGLVFVFANGSVLGFVQEKICQLFVSNVLWFEVFDESWINRMENGLLVGRLVFRALLFLCVYFVSPFWNKRVMKKKICAFRVTWVCGAVGWWILSGKKGWWAMVSIGRWLSACECGVIMWATRGLESLSGRLKTSVGRLMWILKSYGFFEVMDFTFSVKKIKLGGEAVGWQS